MFETSTFNDEAILPAEIRQRWDFMETCSAAAVLCYVCPNEWEDIKKVLGSFALNQSTWLKRGGNRGDVAQEIDAMFSELGWLETRVDLSTEGILLSKDNSERARLPAVYQEGYLVDNFKGRVALDVEWNAKDGNLDRDLSAYRSWHEAGVISAAVLITQDRLSLKSLAERLWGEYQETLPLEARISKLPIDVSTSTTTNLDKTKLRVRRGVMGTCPLLVVAASEKTWNGEPFQAD